MQSQMLLTLFNGSNILKIFLLQKHFRSILKELPIESFRNIGPNDSNDMNFGEVLDEDIDK